MRPAWEPTPEDVSRANVTRFMDGLDRRFDDYHDLHRWSVEDLEGFWGAVWDHYGLGPRGRALASPVLPGKWFEGTRLNYAEQVLTRAPTEAIVAVSEDGTTIRLSRDELRGSVGAVARALRDLGVGPGDRVAGYLPNIPAAAITMLAVSSLGAIWTVCAPDFGVQSVVDRFRLLEPVVLVTVDGYRFGGKHHDRRQHVAQLRAALPSVRATLDVGLLDQLEPAEPEFVPVAADHPLWILFSSGTTGAPKGIVHGHGGIVAEHLKALGLCLDLRATDRFLFHSSTSWMAWNYLVGGLLHGATIVLYDGSPADGALWRVAATTRTTVLGMGSAYVTACRRAGLDVEGVDALRIVIPTGSPLPAAGWEWLGHQLGSRVRIDSICGGTDVCTAFFGGSPLLPVYTGEISTPWLGVRAEAWDSAGRPLIGEVGEFVVTAPMPSMPLGFWADPGGRRFHDAYFATFPGVWRQGDWITRTERGGVVVHGRSDATINKGGVRMGSAEIYAVVERLDGVADSLVVGVERKDGEYEMPLFVVPANGADFAGLEVDIRTAIRRELSPRHVPDRIVAAPAIPRTLTGKKLEVPIKRILQGANAGDVAAPGAIDRPDVLAWYERFGRG